MSVRALRRGSIAASRVTSVPPNVLYLDLPGTNGNAVTTPDSAAASITGDIDIRVKMAPANWATTQYVLCKTQTGNASYNFLIVAGNLRLSGGTSAGSITNTSTATTGFANASTHWARATRASASGEVKFYTSDDGSSWTQLGTTISGTAGTWVDNTARVAIGTGESATLDFLMFTGKIYYAEVRSGIAGTVVASFDATAVTKTATRTPTTYTAPTGEVWTVNGSAWDWVT